MEQIFCVVCAFILYELSGLIGKEMLSDKHITGKGKGYCDITFGKESKKSLIVNIQYNIFAPIIYMLLIAALLQYMGMQELSYKAVYIVPCYYIVRGLMITVVSGKRQLYNFGYECRAAIPGIVLAFLIQKVLVLSGKSILPTLEEFRTQLWLVFFAMAYQFFVRILGKSDSIKQNRVCTPQMKQKYILDKYELFRRKYDAIVGEVAPGNYLKRVIYSIMIYENYNRTATQRWCENILFLLGKRPMTLGIMQVKTTTFIRDATSIELGCKKVKQSFQDYVAEARRECGGENYYFEAGEPERCLEKICQDYNGARDYTDAIKNMFYILPGSEYGYDETIELMETIEPAQENTEPEYKEVYSLYDMAAEIGKCPHIILREGYYLDAFDSDTPYTTCYQGEIGIVFCVENVENLSITGEDAMIYMGEEGSFRFRNCKRLTLRNIGFICQAEQKNATAVLRFENCEGVRLESIECMGRSGRALEMNHCVQVRTKNIRLRDCSQGAVLVEQSELTMENSQIRHTSAKSDNAIIDIHDSVAVLTEIILDDNRTEGYLIRNENSRLEYKDVLVHNCQCTEICNQEIRGGVSAAEDLNYSKL